MNPALLPFLTLLWGIHTWSAQQKQTLAESRAKADALYGNPFLLACDELQSRIYNLLAGPDTFSVLRAHYPDGAFAEETLYLILQYFGWERHTYRYGPYSEDSNVIALTSRIRDDFATAQRFPAGAFCFFRTEQRALGESVIKLTTTESGPSQETISLFDFQTALLAKPFSELKSVQSTLAALRSANSATDLEGRDRLAQVQNDVVKLVEYLEGRLGVSLVTTTRIRVPVPETSEEDSHPVLLAGRA